MIRKGMDLMSVVPLAVGQAYQRNCATVQPHDIILIDLTPDIRCEEATSESKQMNSTIPT